MKLPRKERFASSAVVIALAGVLAVLAVLQYRWSREVSEAASDRMRANLQNSMIGLRQDLYREFSGVGMAFQGDPAAHTSAHDADAFTQRLREWSRTAAHPGLVRNVYVLEDAASGHPRLLRLDGNNSRFETVDWPPQFARFRAPLQMLSSEMASRPHLIERLRQHHEFVMRQSGVHPLHQDEPRPSMPQPGGPTPPLGALGPDPGVPATQPGLTMRIDGPETARIHNRRGNMMFQRRMPRGGPWTVDLVTPALLHAQIDDGKPDGPAKISWIILDLDPKLIQEHILPELAQRYFGGPQGLTFDVAIVGNDERDRVLYTSNPQLVSKSNVVPDGMLPLFGPFGGAIFAGIAPAPPPNAGPARAHDIFAAGPVHLEPFLLRAQGGDWRLIVKHRKGSLEAAVTALYRRNLAISFGILLVLAATMTMIVTTARRAQRLAHLQMDFVAGVSHELRTPLAVINSAAENIEDGIVDNKQRLMRYGSVIRKQVRQLTQLVEQILLFASTQDGEHKFNLKLVQVRDVVDQALANTEELTRAAGFDVERHVEENVPPLRADLLALSQCVQNLVTNAVKYSGDARWIRVSATSAGKPDGSKEVLISVEDRGLGIAPHELHRIFDPFYRSPAATAAQIHGTGLGLSLAKKIAEGMCGHITVQSEPGRGSCFTLHLPASEADQPSAPESSPVTAHGPVQA